MEHLLREGTVVYCCMNTHTIRDIVCALQCLVWKKRTLCLLYVEQLSKQTDHQRLWLSDRTDRSGEHLWNMPVWMDDKHRSALASSQTYLYQWFRTEQLMRRNDGSEILGNNRSYPRTRRSKNCSVFPWRITFLCPNGIEIRFLQHKIRKKDQFAQKPCKVTTCGYARREGEAEKQDERKRYYRAGRWSHEPNGTCCVRLLRKNAVWS